MTLNELKNDVAKLGFESFIEDEGCFIISANRALSLIYTDRPVYENAVIPIRGPRVTLVREFIEHHSGDEITIAFSGKALSFRSYGKGVCKITDQRGTNTVPLLKQDQLTRQTVHSDGVLTFSGDYYYVIRNLAVFDDLVSDTITDVPEHSPTNEISPENYCDNFRAFADLARDVNGEPVPSVKLINGKLRVPHDFRGDLYLTYYRTPKPISAENPNALIDISTECEPMLPLLTAAFMWLDDDAGKAQYYMSLYRDLVANVRRYSINKIDTEYRVNGWA